MNNDIFVIKRIDTRENKERYLSHAVRFADVWTDIENASEFTKDEAHNIKLSLDEFAEPKYYFEIIKL